jgi:hypothetical protein
VRVDVANRAVDDESSRSEDLARVELQADGLVGQAAGALGVRPRQHASRAALQPHDARLGVADPLGKDEDVASAGEVPGDAREHRVVGLGRLVGVVLAPHHRNGADGIEQGREDRDLPEGRLREWRDGARSVRQHEDRIDEAVEVVGPEDARPRRLRRDVPDHLDVPEVEADDPTEEREQQATGAASGAGRVRREPDALVRTIEDDDARPEDRRPQDGCEREAVLALGLLAEGGAPDAAEDLDEVRLGR